MSDIWIFLAVFGFVMIFVFSYGAWYDWLNADEYRRINAIRERRRRRFLDRWDD